MNKSRRLWLLIESIESQRAIEALANLILEERIT